MINAQNTGPCENKVNEERKSVELQSKVGMTCIANGKEYRIEKVDSQHFYVRSADGSLSIVKHEEANF